MGGGPLGQSQSFFFLVMVGTGLGDLWVRGLTSGERSGVQTKQKNVDRFIM